MHTQKYIFRKLILRTELEFRIFYFTCNDLWAFVSTKFNELLVFFQMEFLIISNTYETTKAFCLILDVVLRKCFKKNV